MENLENIEPPVAEDSNAGYFGFTTTEGNMANKISLPLRSVNWGNIKVIEDYLSLHRDKTSAQIAALFDEEKIEELKGFTRDELILAFNQLEL